MQIFNKGIQRLTSMSVVGAVLSLSACTADEARDIEQSNRAAPTLMSTAANHFIGGAVSFGVSSIFAFGFSEDTTVDLSEESLQEIADIVDTSLATARFDEYEALTQALFTASSEYNRPNCADPAPEHEVACNDIEDTFGDKVDPIVGDSNDLWNLLTHPNRNTDPIRLFYAQAIQMVAGIRLAFLAERRNIDELRGIEQSTQSGKNVCDRAREYYPVLQDLEFRWNDYIVEGYSGVYQKTDFQNQSYYPYTPTHYFWGCYQDPSGEEHCSQTRLECTGYDCSITGTAHLEEGERLKAQSLEKDWQTIMGGDVYYDNLEGVAQIVEQCDGAPPSVPPPCDPHLTSGEAIHTNERLWSCNGQYNLVMQGDGNLVLYGPSGATWASGTVGSGANRAIMQGDGNFVVYNGGSPKWASGTNKPENSGAKITLGDDGKLVITQGDRKVWSKG